MTTDRLSLLDRAIDFAARAHEGQRRKAGDVPYIVHPVAVAMTLQQMGCDETVVIAALLHDTVEDTAVTLSELRHAFGDAVADIVAGCTEPSKNASWEVRKQHIIQSLRNAPMAVKLVSAADKFHNLSHMLRQHGKDDADPWRRFSRGKEQQAWFYRNVVASILANVEEPDRYPIFRQLAALVDELFDGILSQPPGEGQGQ